MRVENPQDLKMHFKSMTKNFTMMHLEKKGKLTFFYQTYNRKNLNFSVWFGNLKKLECPLIVTIVDVRVTYIRKLAILGDRNHIVTAN